MTSSAPQIGFDRFIRLEWAAAALRVRAEVGTLDELNALLDAAGLGIAARKKTRTVLNRLWLEPRPELADFAERGVAIFKADPTVPIVALTWGMAVATYPFFGKVSELVGRLLELQGDCSSAEVHRRMSESYGEREGTRRMTNMVLQSQADWGAIERVDNARRIIRKNSTTTTNDDVVCWLIEGALRYIRKSVSITKLSSISVLYPFVIDKSIWTLVSKNPYLAIHSHGINGEVVSLTDKIYASKSDLARA